MYTKNTAILIFCLFFVLTICKGQSPSRKARVIVLCDVSNSVTLYKSESGKTGNLDKLKEYVRAIPDWSTFQLGSEIHFYPVTNNLLSSPLRMPVSYNAPTTSALYDEKKRVAVLKEQICQSLDSLKQSDPSSCVLLSVKRAVLRFNELAHTSTKKMSNELIIVSDMLENSKIDKVRIDMTTINPDQLAAAIKTFEKQNPGLNASNLDLKVSILVNSPGMSNSYKAVQQCWEKWFLSIGVKPQNLFFYTGDPGIRTHFLLRSI